MQWLADFVLVVHFGFVIFITGGLVMIGIGAIAKWRWVRNRRFRSIHLAGIVFVAVEALLGMECPLTRWEDVLRGVGSETGFIAHWIHRVLFYDFPGWIFTTVYVIFALVVGLTWWRIPPQRRRMD